LTVLSCLVTTTLVDAFAISTPQPVDKNPNMPAFREVLREAGKKVFRPGGTEATNKLHSWARGIDSNSRAIEFATGPGSGMSLAERYGCKLLITDPDPERLKVASEVARERGLSDKVEFKQVDMANMSFDGKFDAALVEAVLTKYPKEQKIKILKDIHDMTDQVLLHEICIRGCEFDESPCAEGVKSGVGDALATGYNPLTTDGWIHVLEESGFAITDIETGPIRLIKPLTILQDEGPAGAANFAWSLATQEEIRDRFFSTREVLESYETTLGYMIVHAVKQQV